MAWRKPTEEDLISMLSQEEADAFRQSSDMADDPLARQIENTVEFVRGNVRAAGARLGPAGTVPGALIVPTLCYLRYNYLTRLGVPVGDDRRRTYEDALATFEKVANGKIAVEPPDEEESTASPLSPGFAPPAPRRLLD